MILIQATNSRAEHLTFGYHEYLCPIMCDPKVDKQDGFVLDILNEIGEQKGLDVALKFIPKARLVSSLKAGDVDFLLLPGSPIKKFKLERTEQPIVYFTMGVMHRRDHPFVFSGVDSLKEVVWGVENGQRWRPAYQEHIDKNRNAKVVIMSGENVYERMSKMIAQKRIDVVIGQFDMMERVLWKAGLKKDLVVDRTMVFGERVPLYLAFNPENPKTPELSEFFSKGVEHLAKAGRLKEIFASYNVGEWAGIRLSEIRN